MDLPGGYDWSKFVCRKNINASIEKIYDAWTIPKTEVGRVNFHLSCMQGWTFYLANLKSFLEGGIDLRNKNESLKNMINS